MSFYYYFLLSPPCFSRRIIIQCGTTEQEGVYVCIDCFPNIYWLFVGGGFLFFLLHCFSDLDAKNRGNYVCQAMKIVKLEHIVKYKQANVFQIAKNPVIVRSMRHVIHQEDVVNLKEMLVRQSMKNDVMVHNYFGMTVVDLRVK